MQGTVIMLMALSGLGCHNKSCDVAYGPPTYSCFSGGCYANVYPDYASPSCYSGCFSSGYSGCYSSYYGSCYGGCYSGNYGGHHGCGLFAKLFSCFRHSGGHGCYGGGYAGSGCYGGSYGGFGGYNAPYDPPIFGYALQYNYGSMDPYNQGPSGVTSPTPAPTPTPSEAVAPVAPNPVPTPTAPSPSTPVPSDATPPPPPAPLAPGNVVPPIPKPSA
jgi:hypothetical protein